jgi:hypothetical protein
MAEPELPLPTFLIIGAQKSATRWLRLNLGLHPDVFTAPRELEFFNSAEHFLQDGPEWYRRQFEDGRASSPSGGDARLHVLGVISPRSWLSASNRCCPTPC